MPKVDESDALLQRVPKIQRAKKHHTRKPSRFYTTNTTAVPILRVESAIYYSCIACALRKTNWQRNCFLETNVITKLYKCDLLFENAALEPISCLELYNFKN